MDTQQEQGRNTRLSLASIVELDEAREQEAGRTDGRTLTAL